MIDNLCLKHHNMNKIQYCTLLVSGIFLSCNCADDGTPDVDTVHLAKRWYYQRQIVNGTTTLYQENECNREFVDIQEGVYRFVDKSACEEQLTESGTYTFNATALTFTNVSGGVMPYKVMYLNSETMILDGHFDIDSDGTADRIRLNLKSKI